MNLDLLLPFGILVVMVVYFIYSRQKFEKNIVSLYENKFENWKEHHAPEQKPMHHKELVGLMFKENGKITVELQNKSVKRAVEQGKFDIKE